MASIPIRSQGVDEDVSQDMNKFSFGQGQDTLLWKPKFHLGLNRLQHRLTLG